MIRTSFLLILSIILLWSCSSHEQRNNFQPIEIFPDQIKWESLPESNTSGAKASVLIGNLDDQGTIYELRVHLKNGGYIKPHKHPDDRYVTVLSGELHAGLGKSMDEENITIYPAGSFFVTPAGIVHFARAGNGDVIYQEAGIGPTGTDFIKE